MSASLLERAVKAHGPAKVLGSLAPAEQKALRFTWRAWARPEQLAPLGVWLIWLVLAGRGFGKALALDTPIPTPNGWTTMGALRVGDQVFDEQGHVCRVTFATAVQHDRDCYRVTFDDGSTIVADGDHRWLTWDKAARKAALRNGSARPQVRTTTEIRETLMAGRDRNHSIEATRALDLPEIDLPIPPYVLGAWLGDGHSKSATLTQGVEDLAAIRSIIQSRGVECGPVRLDRRTGAATFAIGARAARRDASTGRMSANGSTHSALRELGLLNNKHIPTAYLRASADQRRELLAGLMDTDGHCAKGGHVEFCSTEERLASGVFELAASLGFKPSISESRAALRGRDIGPRWRVTWTPQSRVFHLARKVARQHAGKAQRERTRRRYIASVEPVLSVPVRCITVSSPSHLFLAGRSMIPTHNTRTGAEWVRENVESGRAGRIALVAPTAGDARDVLVEGESGILAVSPDHFRPTYEPSKRRITWPNGAQATTYSADEPDRLRGPQHDLAWCDEIAAWRYAVDAWDMLMFGLRLGAPRACVTTTPKPVQIVRDLLKRRGADVVVTGGSTYENAANLAPVFLETVKQRYEGTRLGRQELMAELLDDVPGALWQRAQIDKLRVAKPPEMRRVVVAIDPAVTNTEGSDETGIVVAGKGVDGHGYVIEDLSCRMSPDGWARRAVDAYHRHKAGRIVAEVNNGGDLVERVIRTVDPKVSFKDVRATRGKSVRAEPIAALYEQGKCHHAGSFPALEDQLCSYTPDGYDGSPDRADAMVWALTELLLDHRPAEVVPGFRV